MSDIGAVVFSLLNGINMAMGVVLLILAFGYLLLLNNGDD